ncbi:MAG: hypothetical protein COZ31_07505 [Nitrospirae bacterium CG_4_10_14_3_um_filter_44_29]|nr:MAG: hypothetical protein AUJ60_03400 [Nitrospirae bacterium CG1_02_44_142]PIV43967.1 MAG: hypothetical protein COS28_01305 [Nitrospirae bacterium CG02_land_8_20_14_3_00_44_33]PIV66583.1 MAG: hypothetical protein COS10_05485 [Nitrospirae bacterium CG01_land_8_20_14_3_00_44_22]PIX88001.1 MAG: hypothetical protein COZ31_07505 [Nitrospirae bacterium CG_4_10_14_3_um_filter_44_29]PJA81802.1 MAG: hypothetical protein CO147_08080 [Nitrospirae bacterium CG_4_9_14_3_um_filter_44_28]
MNFFKGGFSILAALMLAAFVGSAQAQDFTINSFHSDLIIHEDSSLTVKEAIEVEFHRPRHGIYREIPFKYTDELGNTFRTPLDVLSVTDEAGKDWKYTAKRSGDAIHIRIGDANKYVSGRQSYVITYSVENAILFFEDHDELYWNVTGNYWKAPIKKASANVNLAVKSKSKNLWASCYTGSLGSRESLCGFDTSGNIAGFLSKKTFASGEGLTIAFGWDKGLVSQPSSWKRFLWALDLKENWVFMLPVLSLIFMINLWNRRGRDPKVRESVTVMYEPPKYKDVPLTPAEVGAVIDEKLDARDITATIIGLAVKGYIKIEETKKEGLVFDSIDYFLAKLKDPDDNLSQFEKALMGKIFSGSMPGLMVSDMKNKFYTSLDSLKETLYGEIVRKGYFLRNPESVRALYIAVGVAVMVIAGFASGFLSPYSMGKNIIAGILAGIPVLAFSRVMPAKTRAGAAAYMDILGFQEFMNRAEKDRLKRMGDQELFSKFLPYAIALDVADNWAKAFEGIYQEPPKWYVSPGGFGTFSPYRFSGSITSMTSSLGSAMYSTPRGSGIGGSGGSGGGGFSGGGFGGGGGGSW